ncbi:MAG TPA: TRAM domain-containing protein [Nitrososphaera sp.]|jgi:predicted RNA-binding protein with TRAM domain
MSYGRRYGGGGEGYGGQRNFGGPKPVETGKEYNVQITEISRQGDGIARVQGFVIFVKGAKIGQKPKIRITNVAARFATGEIATGSTEQKVGVAPQRSEEEKPELQDYKSTENPADTGSQKLPPTSSSSGQP